jgi:cytochrome b
MTATTTTRIWDLPVRLFHWLLVTGVLLQYGTAEFGWLDMRWHFWIGYALLVLLLFRIGWAFVGSENLRWARLLQGPRALLDYARQWRSTPMARFDGHNPLGGWAAAATLIVLLLQALSGLATGDDLEWFGPLQDVLPAIWAERASWLHHRLVPILLTLIALHLAAIAAYALIKRENLAASMLHGRRALDVAAPRLAGAGRALVVLLFAVAVVAALLIWAGRTT